VFTGTYAAVSKEIISNEESQYLYSEFKKIHIGGLQMGDFVKVKVQKIQIFGRLKEE
jgi:Cys-tRNA synthase (O-phospho-L-seryl-tRNA:Cys-tRNA synthase)